MSSYKRVIRCSTPFRRNQGGEGDITRALASEKQNAERPKFARMMATGAKLRMVPPASGETKV